MDLSPGGGRLSTLRGWFYPIRGGLVNEETIGRLMSVVKRSCTESLIDLDVTEFDRVKLMNFHQTKGRETDLAIHVFNRDDFFGKSPEPFEEASRLLYVAISRARQRIAVILPTNPHPLVGPYESLKEIQANVLASNASMSS